MPDIQSFYWVQCASKRRHPTETNMVIFSEWSNIFGTNGQNGGFNGPNKGMSNRRFIRNKAFHSPLLSPTCAIPPSLLTESSSKEFYSRCVQSSFSTAKRYGQRLAEGHSKELFGRKSLLNFTIRANFHCYFFHITKLFVTLPRKRAFEHEVRPQAVKDRNTFAGEVKRGNKQYPRKRQVFCPAQNRELGLI